MLSYCMGLYSWIIHTDMIMQVIDGMSQKYTIHGSSNYLDILFSQIFSGTEILLKYLVSLITRNLKMFLAVLVESFVLSPDLSL